MTTQQLATTSTGAQGLTMPLPVAAPPPPPRATGLSLWVDAAAEAQTIARALVQSFFVPQAYKVNIPPRASREEVDAALEVAVANATGAILLGQSLSTPSFEIDPLTALQNIYVVHGRPGMYAKFKVGLAQAHGHKVWDVEYGPEQVTVSGQRKGTDDVVTITVTMEDAKRAGWASNDTYKKTPADMLWARAASRVVDRIASDALFGIASLEELETDEPAASSTPARVTVEDLAERATQSIAAARTDVREAAAVLAAEQAETKMIDQETWKAINREWVRLGVNGPGAVGRRMEAVIRLVGHPITGGSDLTAEEAVVVLDALQGLDPEKHADRLAEILGQDAPERTPAGDDVPEPDDAERTAAAAEPAAGEPKGWEK